MVAYATFFDTHYQNTKEMAPLMYALAALAVSCALAHVPQGWEALPLGPLGVPGFPDCERDGQGNLVCNGKPRTSAGQIAIACVGDSITAGVGSTGGNNTYPGQLQGLLGSNYVVSNFGDCGSTMVCVCVCVCV